LKFLLFVHSQIDIFLYNHIKSIFCTSINLGSYSTLAHSLNTTAKLFIYLNLVSILKNRGGLFVKKKVCFRFTSLFTMLFLLLSIAIPTGIKVKAASTATITYSFSKENIAPGDTFDINVNISNVEDLYGASIDFKFDPTLFSIEEILPGSAWNGEAQFYGILEDEISTGYFSNYTALGGARSGLNKSGTLFVIKAKALKEGTQTFKTISNNDPLSVNGNNVRIKLSNSQIVNQKIEYTAGVKSLTIGDKIVTLTEGKYEDSHPGIKYVGNWKVNSHESNSETTAKYSNTVGDYFTFTFVGTGFNWYAPVNSNRGFAKITIDDTSYTIDNYSSSQVYKKLVYSKDDLAYGIHTVKIEITGSKNANATALTQFIDYIEIY